MRCESRQAARGLPARAAALDRKIARFCRRGAHHARFSGTYSGRPLDSQPRLWVKTKRLIGRDASRCNGPPNVRRRQICLLVGTAGNRGRRRNCWRRRFTAAIRALTTGRTAVLRRVEPLVLVAGIQAVRRSIGLSPQMDIIAATGVSRRRADRRAGQGDEKCRRKQRH